MLPILAELAPVKRARLPLRQIAAEQKAAAQIARLDAQDVAYDGAAFAAHGDVAARDRRDGLRLTLCNGTTVRSRASDNAPELRVWVEAPVQEAATVLMQEGLHLGGRKLSWHEGGRRRAAIIDVWSRRLSAFK